MTAGRALVVVVGILFAATVWPGSLPGGPTALATAQGALPPGMGGVPPAAEPFDSGPVERVGDCLTTAWSDERADDGARGGAHSGGSDLQALWRITRGEGQTVALIDTGVNPGPRLPRVRGIGDYVADSDGLHDCDVHGTLAAGIVAAVDDGEGVAGLAPEVEILSIRQASSVYRSVGGGDASEAATGDEDTSDGVGTISTLARAVRAAADSGAGVLNISQVACVPAGTLLADETLGAALRYAVVDRDMVVVVAAGNVGEACGQQNEDGLLPHGEAWAGLHTVATPAWYEGLVLTVGAVDESGEPVPFSLRGPWVDVAAPGTDLVTVDAEASRIADRIVHPDGSSTPIEGTSFAAPYVAATAALVRAAHPALTARQVADRIRFTAIPSPRVHDQAVGHGIVDPLAAVTAVAPVDRPPPVSVPLNRGDPVAAGPGSGRGVVIAVVAAGVGLLVIGSVGLRCLIARERT